MDEGANDSSLAEERRLSPDAEGLERFLAVVLRREIEAFSATSAEVDGLSEFMGADAESVALPKFSGAAEETAVSGFAVETSAFSEMTVSFLEFAEERRPFFAAVESPFAAGALRTVSALIAEEPSGFGAEGASAP